ncbi:MAG: type 4a pilus biogenesis protein PilO [bacterium]|nr:type 4a pilus biogenesis protein PilO [bacterium]
MDIDVKSPKFLRWTVAILLVVVVLPLNFLTSSYSLTWGARKTKIAELETRHDKLSKDLEKARLLVRNLDRVEEEYAVLREQWKVAQTLLPEENEMPNLLRKVTAAGEQSGVEFELFRPNSPVNRGFYADNPIEVSVVGGYHQTAVFLSRLANLNRIVNVSGLRFEGIDDQSETPHTVQTDMVLTAYTLGGTGIGDDGTRTLQAEAEDGKPVQTAAAGH